MRNSILRAFLACLRSLLAVLLPAQGQRRRNGEDLFSPPTSTPERVSDGPATALRRLPAPSPGAGNDPAPESTDGTSNTLVRWYVVVHESGQWLDHYLIAQRQQEADLNGDGIEECWYGCPCRRLPATAV
ncbi:hypothetical protein [Streptomyces sp. enrichment culture]|uniref:hypothetical protein n=1 Tax=Streptomyces sp. enrichment culture TaxID=1795815 RepID=UPI003F565A62